MSEVMQTMWSPEVIDWILLSVLLLLGHLLKRKIPFFSKFLLPSAIIAGFLGLLLGPDLLNILPFSMDRLGVYVYHLLALGFISLSLKDRAMTATRPVVKTGLFIVTIYLIQGIAGVAISIIAAATFLPDVFPSIGLLLPLGFGQGPGQAYSVGRAWEEAGVLDGGALGLTIATIGFLWATFGGVIVVNVLKKKYPPQTIMGGDLDDPSTDASQVTAAHGTGNAASESEELSSSQPSRIPANQLFGEPESQEEERGEITLSNMIDVGSRQVFLIGLIYLATYGTLRGLGELLGGLGAVGENLANVLWGFHFVFGTIYAILVKLVMNKLKKVGLMRHQYNNNRLLSRISGTAFDFMVVASIAAISIDVVLNNWLILLFMTTAGGFLTLWFSLLAAKKVFKQDILEYSAVFFGTYTGTLSTGMALLRTVDPTFRTRVADNIVLGGGLALFFAFPLLLIINVPVMALAEGDWGYHFATLAALIVYCLVTGFLLFHRRKARKAK